MFGMTSDDLQQAAAQSRGVSMAEINAKAADIARDYLEDGVPLATGIRKVASACGFNDEQTQRLLERANVRTARVLISRGCGGNPEFDVATPAAVFGHEKTAASRPARPANYTTPQSKYEAGIEKQARLGVPGLFEVGDDYRREEEQAGLPREAVGLRKVAALDTLEYARLELSGARQNAAHCLEKIKTAAEGLIAQGNSPTVVGSYIHAHLEDTDVADVVCAYLGDDVAVSDEMHKTAMAAMGVQPMPSPMTTLLDDMQAILPKLSTAAQAVLQAEQAVGQLNAAFTEPGGGIAARPPLNGPMGGAGVPAPPPPGMGLPPGAQTMAPGAPPPGGMPPGVVPPGAQPGAPPQGGPPPGAVPPGGPQGGPPPGMAG